jgi:hypothetical protein
MKRKTHIDLLNDYFESLQDIKNMEASVAAKPTTKRILNDLCSIASKDYTGYFRLGTGRGLERQIIFFFDECEKLLFVCDKENDYEKEIIGDPDNYLRSMFGIDKYKL